MNQCQRSRKENRKLLNAGLPLGRKLFEEVDTPTGSKVVFEDTEKGVVERESTWIGDIKGYNSFPSGRASGSGKSYIHSNSGITISHWEGVFDTEDNKEQLTFKGRDMNKNQKFIVLRTYFTKSKTLGWINGLVCILSGEFDITTSVFKSIGYELML